MFFQLKPAENLPLLANILIAPDVELIGVIAVVWFAM